MCSVDIFGIWGTHGGVLHMNEIPWQSLQAAGAGEGVPGEPSQIIAQHSAGVRKGGSSQIQHTEGFVPPNWGSSWAWQDSRLLEKPVQQPGAVSLFKYSNIASKNLIAERMSVNDTSQQAFLYSR